MKLIYPILISIIYFHLSLIMTNILSAQEIIFDNIISISNDYTINGKSGNKYKLKAINILKNQQDNQIFSTILLNKQVKIPIEINFKDRYSRLHVNIYGENNIWLNSELIKNGLAVLSGADMKFENFAYLLEQENIARNKNIGGWANGNFKIYNAKPYSGDINKFSIVKGTVLQVKKVKEQIYLNFDSNWRKDFSVGIKKPLWEKFNNIGIDLTNLSKKNITIRGYIREYNGPYMEIYQIGQLELN